MNLPLLSLTDFDDIDVKIIPNHYEIEGDRGYKIYYRVNISYDRVYFDFDDTLVRERKTFIIPSIAFLFQCINEGKKIILLTRHAYSIYETLAKMHLDKGLFDQIIEISEGKSKAEYIENDNGEYRHFECFHGMYDLIDWLGYRVEVMDSLEDY